MTIENLRAAYSEKRWADAWREYTALREAGMADAEAHLMGGRSARALGDLRRACWAFDLAIEAGPTGNVLGQLRFARGITFREAGMIGAAVEELKECIAGITDYQSLAPVMMGAAWYNLGLALRQAKRLTDAIAAYEHAVAHYRAEDLSTPLCMALHNLAWAACCSGDPDRAVEALAESGPLCNTDTLRWHQALTQAFVDSFGDTEDRRRALETCETFGHDDELIPAALRSHAAWLAGSIALCLGQLDAAEALAKQAAHLAGLAKGENRTLHDASELLQSVRQMRLVSKPPGP